MIKSPKEILDEQKNENPNNNNSPDKKKKNGGIRRREVLIGGGAILAALSIGIRLYTRNKAESTINDTESEEKIKRIHLGKFTFQVHKNAMNQEDSETLFENIRIGYQKLVDYFGEEVLMANYPQIINVQLGSSNDDSLGSTSDEITIYKIDEDTFDVKLPTVKNFSIDDVNNQKTITHELFHMGIQWNMPEHGLAFTEGHAELVEEELFGENEDQPRFIEKAPELLTLLGQNGWDITRMDYYTLTSKATEENYESKSLNTLIGVLRYKWKEDWKKVLKKDPDFLKKFYKKVAKIKSEKDLSSIFHYDSLLDISQSVFPGFREWRNGEGRASKRPDSNNPAKIILVKMIDSNKILIVNIGTKELDFSGKNRDKIIYYRAGTKKFNIIGTCETCKNKEMKLISELDNDQVPSFLTIEIPDEFKPEVIIYDGKEKPVIQMKKK